MLRGLRASLVLIFVVLLSHGPFSWGHTHSDLDARQLREHLATYHYGGGESNPPSDWHYHLTWIYASRPYQIAGDAGPAAQVEASSAMQTCQWLCRANQQVFSSEPPLDGPHSQPVSPPDSAPPAHGLRQRETYKWLGVLLI